MSNRAVMYTSGQSKSELIEQHAPLVKRIAYHMIARLPASVDVEDLIQAGMIGLLDASHQYNSAQGASFETYAGIRIRGSMLDEIRRNDWAPRSVHRKAREIAEQMHKIEQEKGRNASDSEVASALGIDINEYYQQLNDSSGYQIFSLDEFTDNDETHAHPISVGPSEPDDEVQDDDFQQALAQAIDTLPERERLLMSLYYNDELNLKEIGEVLGVSESRVSQIHSQTVIRLRAKLRDWIM
ncbi:MAG TPA: RNA polymerase sigma factor FliA [Methylophaga aminisulfidivorans]|uniref:RNA polymerase sigma factor FliA n=1 Tax=Methylophaga TaxID=40222 RepID=UPI0017605364|nr:MULTISPECIES: RNA polymerase sigma factor FliA [Methylophaga]HIC46635.1 RNA polymerase sigma factor FliA [Methylophaga sp.]HIM39238.1 RNA polymerase sigma factor FliA [Methylophaga aminisulfidivorans]